MLIPFSLFLRRTPQTDADTERKQRKKGGQSSFGRSTAPDSRGTMDAKAPCKEVSEAAREDLISISYSLPDKSLNSDAANGTFTVQDEVPLANSDGVEKYRSELISISYCQSPELPVVSEDPKP